MVMETSSRLHDHLPSFLSFTPIFLAVYLFGYFILFKNWIKHRHEASSCLMSLAHGTPAVVLATYSILQASKQSTSQLGFASSNNDFHNMVLDYSLAYFVCDTLHYIVFIPSEVLFIAHHLATLSVLSTCRYIVHHGAVAILGVLILAEITSPCQNTWSLARFRKFDVPAAARYYESMSPIFYVFYSVVRVILGPLFVYKMGLFFASGAADRMIPRWAWISWMVVIVGAIIVSILWILNLWKDWYTRRIKQETKKFS